MTDLLEKVEVDTIVDLIPYEDTNDGKDHLTHIVNPPANRHIGFPGMKAQDIVDIARIRGVEVTALCGYTWVPKRNPEKYPVCQPCVDVAGDIMRELGQ